MVYVRGSQEWFNVNLHRSGREIEVKGRDDIRMEHAESTIRLPLTLTSAHRPGKNVESREERGWGGEVEEEGEGREREREREGEGEREEEEEEEGEERERGRERGSIVLTTPYHYCSSINYNYLISISLHWLRKSTFLLSQLYSRTTVRKISRANQ